MAVKISSQKGSFDQFKTKCPHCGVELEYTRNDIQPHRRWKNGFFYCPRCKNNKYIELRRLQIRKSDEEATLVYYCSNCKRII